MSTILGFHKKTIQNWEIADMIPTPESILTVCEYFKGAPKYFHEYYDIYFNKPGEKIRRWKKKNNYNYPQMMKIFNLSYSGLAKLMSGKIELSFDMYLRLKELRVF